MSISLKRKKIFQKEQCHSSVFRTVFEISRKNFHVIYTLSRFKKRDFVGNNHKVGQWLKDMTVDELEWTRIDESTCHQSTCPKGIYHLLHLY